MARADFRIDFEGVGEVLNSDRVRRVVSDYARRIASNARASLPGGIEVVVDEYTTDRAAASVTVRDPRARGWEARDGTLVRAAAAEGLEVTSR